ncbi:hypothetical protein CEE34_05960 [Candidatus Aerophobetes bacterium Ae_b3a]|nr:MAG: hypothetical protein CEE34_05960 [Candidatus Aerophobetes bacterium Ae_b3a]
MKNKFASVYFSVFGLIVLGLGIAELIIGIAGKSFTWSILEISGGLLLWKGIILFFAGFFYLSSVKNLSEIHQLAKNVMASVMLWTIAGMQIFAIITESIPGGEEGWINTWEGFLSAYSPPYIPALILLPFSLVTVYYVYAREK